MKKKNTHSLTNTNAKGRRSKDKTFKSQERRAFKAFQERPKTMLEVSIETGILRANLCRRIAEWREADRVQVIYRGLCPITKHKAGFFTTDPNQFITPKHKK